MSLVKINLWDPSLPRSSITYFTVSSEWPEQKRGNVISEISLNRHGQPEKVVACVLFLASDKASFITGEILDVNGGCLMD